MVKNLPANQEPWVWSLGQEDLLEKCMPTHSSTLSWRIPWTEEPGGPQSMESQRSRTRLTNSTTIRILYFCPRSHHTSWFLWGTLNKTKFLHGFFFPSTGDAVVSANGKPCSSNCWGSHLLLVSFPGQSTSLTLILWVAQWGEGKIKKRNSCTFPLGFGFGNVELYVNPVFLENNDG